MEHRSVSHILLFAGAVIALVAAIVLLGVFPYLLWASGGRAFLRILCTAGDAVLTVAVFSALYRYVLICREIGNDRSFCRENAGNMERISRLLWICAAVLGLLAIPVSFLLVIWPVLLIAAVGSGGLGVIAYALARLLQHAASLQEENDLTV